MVLCTADGWHSGESCAVIRGQKGAATFLLSAISIKKRGQLLF
ncbi:hypothetical protein NBRC3257_2113 [Gluconobacter thailandicus NBRC 3257]|uniref:Transposase n=1 Tax=Gluconobacter thailandicus NBRC 3257 TaxID=1381097 RepID=A0ABQ0IY28_GLUTH|nr:hypothetical protein NBRC3257_2113 [Gluconobacter thailandicus NBRC 3257]